MKFKEFPPAPESAPETVDAVKLSVTKSTGESQSISSIAQQRFIQIVLLHDAITQEVKKFEAMRSLRRLLPYIVMLADISFDLHNIIQLLEYWFKPRYDAAVEAHGGDEAAKRVVHMLVSKSLEPLGLATKIGRRRSINFNFKYSVYNYFVTEMTHDIDGLDFSMVPLEDIPHLLKRMREYEEEIDYKVQLIMRAAPDLATLYHAIMGVPRDCADSGDLTERSDSAESVNSSE